MRPQPNVPYIRCEVCGTLFETAKEVEEHYFGSSCDPSMTDFGFVMFSEDDLNGEDDVATSSS
jgi:hypothetical protein